MQCNLLVDDPQDGAWNMAVDELLLESAVADQTAFLRFYRWREPTLSFGYFQRYADRLQHTPSLNCPVVRRLSGGGAILHDLEWTYSLALPVEGPLGKNPGITYNLVQRATLATLSKLGLSATAYVGSDAGVEPFLCFQRRSPGDLVVQTAKIMGSAQRRRNGAILQHGSLLLGRSASAPELPGIGEILPELDLSGLIPLWSEQLARVLDLSLVNYALTQAQLTNAGSLLQNKFGNDRWTRRR